MMNRLQAPPLVAPKLSTHPGCEAGVISSAEDNAHSLFAPLHYEPNYGYPLLVWLHGGGDSERQLRRVMPLVSLRNYVAVAARGTLAVPRSAGGGSGYRWVQTPEHIAQAQRRISGAIAAAGERFNIRTDRIFLAGYESGGTMALRLAAEDASRFAGMLSLGGPFPTHGAPLAKFAVVRHLPLFIAACRDGQYYPTQRVCNDLRLLHTAGISLTLREYPGGDGLSPTMLADVDRWIMEQIAQQAPCPIPSPHS